MIVKVTWKAPSCLYSIVAITRVAWCMDVSKRSTAVAASKLSLWPCGPLVPDPKTVLPYIKGGPRPCSDSSLPLCFHSILSSFSLQPGARCGVCNVIFISTVLQSRTEPFRTFIPKDRVNKFTSKNSQHGQAFHDSHRPGCRFGSSSPSSETDCPIDLRLYPEMGASLRKFLVFLQ